MAAPDARSSISGHGSGTLLDNEWVLTAAHVVDDIAAPEDITVRRGNAGDSGAEVRHGLRTAIHHAYVKRANQDIFTVDVARLVDGSLRVIEIGDGGVSTLPPTMDVRAFYRAIANRWHAAL